MIEKPPLGIMPRYLWEEKRLNDVTMAIYRFIQTGNKIKIEWVEEYNELIEKVKTR